MWGCVDLCGRDARVVCDITKGNCKVLVLFAVYAKYSDVSLSFCKNRCFG